ncbi:MAG: hypothetical protein IPJ41_02860 [Phycisphaerales bacterium]|nr:hypothetical protein [Phycisphaerales bacterium]
MNRILRMTVAALWVFVGAGCGSSVWQKSFAYEPGRVAATPTASVVVREAPWDRVGPALAAERERIAQSDTHRDDWPAEQARANDAALLKSLQLPADAGEMTLLGRSSFKTTHQPDPAGADLSKFAESVGADYAIWSRRLLGKADTVEREPVQQDRWRWEPIWDADRNRFVYVRRWDTDTAWVPVVVKKDEVRWVVFYVKRGG